MNADQQDFLRDPAWHGALLWYGVDAYGHLARMDETTARNISMQISDALACNERMFMREAGSKFASVNLPVLGERSGPYCIAFASAYLVWNQRKAFGDGWANPGSPLLEIADEAFRMWRALYPGDAPAMPDEAVLDGVPTQWQALVGAFERVYENTWGRPGGKPAPGSMA